MRAVQRMNWKNPFLLNGMKVKTSKADHFPISQIRLTRFQGGHFREFGPLIKGR